MNHYLRHIIHGGVKAALFFSNVGVKRLMNHNWCIFEALLYISICVVKHPINLKLANL